MAAHPDRLSRARGAVRSTLAYSHTAAGDSWRAQGALRDHDVHWDLPNRHEVSYISPSASHRG